MLDIKFVRQNPQLVREALKKRGYDFALDGFLVKEQQYRDRIGKIEALRSQRLGHGF